ncbi:diguanylate cyclase [Pseudomonas typographi]|uniref:diguanylate cyclase n=1 Tax=Pseudomonas typographi TaxID=2715964 RepID=A0ABR7Z7J4_9PSED|nr:diguanylate cyclase [Pseudomonas typographi]MBD1601511.1 diguanylate cyclase [Pseudomonas typographi]
MTVLPDSTHARLHRHFAQRIAHQARELLAIWQRLREHPWGAAEHAALESANQRLARSAERLEQVEYLLLAMALAQTLQCARQETSPNADIVAELDRLMHKLSRSALRHDDVLANTPLPLSPAPVYLLLKNAAQAEQLADQLETFGVAAIALGSYASAQAALHTQPPSALLVDVDFQGNLEGLAVAQRLIEQLPVAAPLLFYRFEEADTATRLAAVRVGGRAFINAALEAPRLLETLESLAQVARYAPYRVLVIDDSPAQARHTARMLGNAGILARPLSDPMRTFAEIAEFQPDLLLLDLYMPHCSGPELARVIRQNERYMGLPIIYLSAEQDLDKQLDALTDGGDDFLVKPVRSRQLITTVRNRAERARQLGARMVRDSLTGLFNHTYILQQLDDCITRAQRDGQPLCFAMLDIDHFKKVNDTHGHPMGDRVIKSLALFLGQRLRKTDFIGRYGGEEFAIVMPATELAAASEVLDDIRQRFAGILYPAAPQDLRCTFSAGVVQMSEKTDSLVLAALADDALYRAKAQGRNCVVAAG